MVASGSTTAQTHRIWEQLRRFDPRTIERLSPDEQSRLGQFLARYGDDGGRLIADGGENLRRLTVRSDGLDEATTRAVLRAHARGDLDDAALRRTARYLDEGRMDQADVRRMEQILRERHFSPFIDESIDASDLLAIGARNSDLQDARIVLRDSGGRLRWLEIGDDQ